MRKRTPVCLSVLMATTFSVIPVLAQLMWWANGMEKTDVNPIIIIRKNWIGL